MWRAMFLWCAASGVKDIAWRDRRADHIRSAAGRDRPGRLVLVVGPSGAGKDTLIGLARAACADDGGIVFPRRVVTREASSFEDNEQMSLETLSGRRATMAGSRCIGKPMAMATRLPRAIDDEIRAGRTVVANVSRTVIDDDAPRLCRCRGGLDHGAARDSRGASGGAGARQRREDRGSARPRRRTVQPRRMSPSSMSAAPRHHARELVRIIRGG